MLCTNRICLEINLQSVVHTFIVIIDKLNYGAVSTALNLKAETGKQSSELLLKANRRKCHCFLCYQDNIQSSYIFKISVIHLAIKGLCELYNFNVVAALV